jgi:putative Ca2+/H+ antiporter (TMEM165/GDT1 family)
MDLSVITSSFALLFLAEMGDKTQLMAMALAHRYRPLPVVAGVLLSFLLLNLLAVLLGAALFRYVPQTLVLVAAGILFLFFGWRSWREANTREDRDEVPQPGRNAFLASFSLILLAELGDKTQLAMVALAASTGAVWSVFIGGTLALWTVSLIGIALGATVLRKVPRRWVHRVAGVLFASFGLLALLQAALEGINPANPV